MGCELGPGALCLRTRSLSSPSPTLTQTQTQTQSWLSLVTDTGLERPHGWDDLLLDCNEADGSGSALDLRALWLMWVSREIQHCTAAGPRLPAHSTGEGNEEEGVGQGVGQRGHRGTGVSPTGSRRRTPEPRRQEPSAIGLTLGLGTQRGRFWVRK